jgi:hypothetical protein
MIPPSLMLPEFAERIPESIRGPEILHLVIIRLAPCHMQLPKSPALPDNIASFLLQGISTIDLIDQMISYFLTPKKKEFTFGRLHLEL